MEQTPREPEVQYTTEEAKRRGMLGELFIRLVKEKPLGTVGLVIVIALFFTGIFADLSYFGFPDLGLAPYGFNEINLAHRLDGPSGEHILGADNLGRDMLSRIIFGARVSMYVGLGAVVLSVAEATFIGTICGFFGGKVDIIIQRFVDAWMCIPGLFILLLVMATFSGIMHPILLMILVLGLVGGIGSSRLVRSAVIAIKGNMYVDAAKAILSHLKNTSAAYPAQCYAGHNYHVINRYGRCHNAGGLPELPRLRSAPADAQLGRYAQWQRTHPHDSCSMDDAMAWSCPGYGDIRYQYVRRCREGPTGPKAEGWSGTLLRSREAKSQTGKKGGTILRG